MDAGLLKAGLVMAVGLTLLVPTFNALNASYVQNVRPPPWMPTPPTPPDMTPPTDMTPPPDFTPPTNYKGPIPPGMKCPPPVFRALNDTKHDFAIQSQPTGGGANQFSLTFTVPNSTLAVGGYVNFTDWRGNGVSTTLQPASKGKTWTQSDNQGSFVTPKTSSFLYNSTKDYSTQVPPPGNWTLTMDATFGLAGTVHTEFGIVLACGGLGAG